MKPLLTAFLLILLLSFEMSLAQNDFCGSDKLHRTLMNQDPEYRDGINELNSKVQEIIQKQITDKSGLTTIPVVVHVIHLGESIGIGSNISDVQIFRAINKLNDDFKNITGGIDMEIEFCLATTDPNSQPTTGINRIDGSAIPRYAAEGITGPGCGSFGAQEKEIKDLSNWSADDYYNIWVVKDICSGIAGIAGYADQPVAPTTYDGTVLIYTYMDSPYTLLSHEIGHGLFLLHTFNGCCSGSNYKCPDNTDCTKQGDFICDTPPHKKNDCGATNPCSSQGNWDNSRYNIMSYCPGKNRFTLDQKNRMKATLSVNPMFQLVWSTKCSNTTAIKQETSNIQVLVANNPSSGNYTISLKGIETNVRIRVYNSVGKLVNTYNKDASEFDIHISNPAGIYYLEVSTKEKYSKMIKLIKW